MEERRSRRGIPNNYRPAPAVRPPREDHPRPEAVVVVPESNTTRRLDRTAAPRSDYSPLPVAVARMSVPVRLRSWDKPERDDPERRTWMDGLPGWHTDRRPPTRPHPAATPRLARRKAASHRRRRRRSALRRNQVDGKWASRPATIRRPEESRVVRPSPRFDPMAAAWAAQAVHSSRASSRQPAAGAPRLAARPQPPPCREAANPRPAEDGPPNRPPLTSDRAAKTAWPPRLPAGWSVHPSRRRRARKPRADPR